MIIVTGTKRSGTSMWMQVFKAAGLPLIGVAFPRDWGRSIRAANRAGFYESALRHGIHPGTNPHPRTGRLIRAEDTRRVAVKVFASGVVRTDRMYLDYVVATLRDVHEYVQSWQRLFAMEQAHMERRARVEGRVPEYLERRQPMPADLEWWSHNVALLRDAQLRGYPMQLRSYASVLAKPKRAVEELFAWLDVQDADLMAAVAAIRSDLRTQIRPPTPGVLPSLNADQTALCEELHAVVDAGLPVTSALTGRLVRAHERLAPRIHVAQRLAKERRRLKPARDPHQTSPLAAKHG
jgi:hypothetical protein